MIYLKSNTMSIKCLRRHPYNLYVSCSPSKIPYVGFSPVRLQTGIKLQPSPQQHNLNARHICITLTMTYMQLKSWSLSLVALTDNLNIAELTAMTIQSRDPWLSCGLCCPTGSSLIMVSSETLDPLTALFSSSSKSLSYILIWMTPFFKIRTNKWLIFNSNN